MTGRKKLLGKILYMLILKRKVRWSRVVLCLLGVLGLAGGTIEALHSSSVRMMNCGELYFQYYNWDREGRPEGERFVRFVENQRSYLPVFATNLTLTVGNTKYVSLFAWKREKLIGFETLLVTTNGVLLSLSPSGRAIIVPLDSTESKPSN